MFTTNCTTGNSRLYHWGHYEDLVNDMYNNPEKGNPLRQIEYLTKDIEDARGAGLPLPPGVQLHLGYMHMLVGDMNAAMISLNNERAMYPESATLIDFMLKKKRAPKPGETPTTTTTPTTTPEATK